jgi:hypothetical protein
VAGEGRPALGVKLGTILAKGHAQGSGPRGIRLAHDVFQKFSTIHAIKKCGKIGQDLPDLDDLDR